MPDQADVVEELERKEWNIEPATYLVNLNTSLSFMRSAMLEDIENVRPKKKGKNMDEMVVVWLMSAASLISE